MPGLAPKSKGLLILQGASEGVGSKPKAKEPSKGHILAKDLLSAIEGKDSEKLGRVLDSMLKMSGA